MSLKYSAEEVAKHKHPNDLWIALHGKVYDVTKFVTEHPGGEEVLIALAGHDASKCFDEIGHSEEAIQLKDLYEIGELVGTLPPGEKLVTKENKSAEKQPTIDDDNWTYEEPKKESSSFVLVFAGLAALVYAVLFYYMFY